LVSVPVPDPDPAPQDVVTASLLEPMASATAENQDETSPEIAPDEPISEDQDEIPPE
jgi:hypothetical protein